MRRKTSTKGFHDSVEYQERRAWQQNSDDVRSFAPEKIGALQPPLSDRSAPSQQTSENRFNRSSRRRRHAHIAARHPLIHSAHKFRPPTRRLTARIARFILPRPALFTGALHAMPAWKFFLRLRRRFFISDLTPRRRHFSGVIIVSRRIACIAMPAAPRPIVTPLNHNPPRPKIYHGRADLPIRAARTSFSVVTNFTRLKILPRAIQSGRSEERRVGKE